MSKARDLADGTFDTDTLVVDAANNRVGVGTASPGELLDVSGNIRALGANSRVMFGPDGFEASIKYATDASLQIASRTGEPTTFTNGTDGSEAMRISGGNVLIGSTSSSPANIRSVDMFVPTAGTIRVQHSTANDPGDAYLNFNYNASNIGSITQSGTNGVAYNTSSDYRLKENVVDLTGASDRINQIPVHRFNFIADPDTTVDGFLWNGSRSRSHRQQR